MGLKEQAAQFQSVLGRFLTVNIRVTTIKVSLVLCGFELAGLNVAS